MTKRMKALVFQGQMFEEKTVKIEDGKAVTPEGDYVLIASPLFKKGAMKSTPYLLCSSERSATFSPPTDTSSVPLGRPGREIQVQVTPQLWKAVNVAAAARALAAAQKPPFWLMVMMLGAGIGVGWILKMLFDVVGAKVASGGA